MGKGDLKSKKGKISRGSYGVLRPRKKNFILNKGKSPKTEEIKEGNVQEKENS
ncbi:MAG TPA: 30S ribosomal protein THX [Cyclobacteriaceae bacterium]